MGSPRKANKLNDTPRPKVETTVAPDTTVIRRDNDITYRALRFQLRERDEKIAILERKLAEFEEKHEFKMNYIIKENKILRDRILKHRILQEKTHWYF